MVDQGKNGHQRALEALLGVPTTDGNIVTVLRNGDEIFPAMLDAIRGAEHTVDLLSYVWWKGDICTEFAEALATKAREGVRVRVLLDAIGARLMEEDDKERMEDAGVSLWFFRSVNDLQMWESTHRTHRRALVVDGQVGFTGGVGIADEWTGDANSPDEWRDTHLRLDGPAVDGLRAAFLQNWGESDHPFITEADRYPALSRDGDKSVMVVRSSAGHGVSSMSMLKTLMIELAQERVRITSAYLAPEEHAKAALARACDRGVEVELLVPGDHIDKRVAKIAAEQHFEELLDIGVRIYTYDRTMLHAKTMTVDGVVADIGTANFNSRSFSQDEEVNVVVFDPEVAGLLDEHFDQDLEHSTQVTPELWDDRGWVQRAAENAVSLVDGAM
ncbi:MAG: phospholipase D-like domain-containing protein [Nitriliruptorales bacterium]|nr:phospholipase D-like domain-containing protein [Nitriliruptorales bacterium]